MAIRHFLISSASAIALFSGVAHAQSTDPNQPPTNAPPSGAVQPAPSDTGSNEEIVVTGFRGALAENIEAKRQSSVIADILTAEDIGKFPDKNVAEALQRIPGVVINREFGEGERVNVRGTAANLTKTLLNGHNVATADWFILDQLAATRAFNYLTLPAEIVGELEVYKSPQADIEEGGVGATINVHTRNPLDLDPLTISASAQVVYSERADKWNPQASGLISWKNASETFGVLLGAVYQKRDIRRDGVEVLTYFQQLDNPATPADETIAGGAQIPGLIGSALFKQERERIGGNIGLQFRPSDALEINVTGLYSRFNADNFNQNFMAWGSQAIGGGGTLTNFTVEDDTVTSGTITSNPLLPNGRAVVFDAIDRLAVAKVWSADFDTLWHASDIDTVHFKLGYTEAHGDTKAQPFYEGGAPGSFTFDLTGRTPQVQFSGIDPTDPNDLILDFGSLHKITNSDKEWYGYLDYEHELTLGPINAIKVGAKYTDHDRKTGFLATTFGGFFGPLSATGCGGGPCTSADFADGLTPGDFLDNIALSGTLTQYWQVDRDKLEDIYLNFPHPRVINPPENYSINEKTYGGYVMAKFGGENWRGNVGLRVIHTDQTSRGNQVFPANGTAPPEAIDNPFGPYIPIKVDRSYTDWLPSANVSFDLNPALVLRFAAARTMARPDYTDIVPRVSLNPGALTGNGGDPFVDPFRANQYDVSIEWYPDRETIVAAALYYKDIQSYIVNTVTQETFPIQTNTPNLSRCTLVSGNTYDCLFDINRRSNGAGGSNKGFEFQVQRPIWNGFGAIANYTYSDAKSDDGGPIPGNSKHAFNLTGYYEAGPISARLSYTYRSKFFIDIDRATPLNQKATQSLDASASYKLTENFWITADAVNLTNDKIEQYSGTTTRPRAIYDNGRQFYIGARFKY